MSQVLPDAHDFFTESEVCRYLGVDTVKLQELIDTNEIPPPFELNGERCFRKLRIMDYGAGYMRSTEKEEHRQWNEWREELKAQERKRHFRIALALLVLALVIGALFALFL